MSAARAEGASSEPKAQIAAAVQPATQPAPTSASESMPASVAPAATTGSEHSGTSAPEPRDPKLRRSHPPPQRLPPRWSRPLIRPSICSFAQTWSWYQWSFEMQMESQSETSRRRALRFSTKASARISRVSRSNPKHLCDGECYCHKRSGRSKGSTGRWHSQYHVYGLPL